MMMMIIISIIIIIIGLRYYQHDLQSLGSLFDFGV